MTTEIDRRRFIGVTAATASAALLAGCSDDDGPPADDGDNGDGDGADEPDGFAIDPGTEVVLDGYTQHWEGVAPAAIEGEENPTLVLEEGAEYTFEWINADNVMHDLQLRDDSGDVVNDLETDPVQEEGESATLEVTADSAIATYVCSYHVGTQSGDIAIE